jgi:probable rRNA maturation factor
VPAIIVKNARGAPSLDARALKRRAERMLKELGEEDSELSVVLTDDVEIEALNRTHRRKAKPTDVLAFPMDEGGGSPSGQSRLLGDVVISLDTAARQARERRRELMAEVTHLLAHGVLHLVGYDHRTDAEERAMNAVARRLVDRANERVARRGNVVQSRARSRLTSRAR